MRSTVLALMVVVACGPRLTRAAETRPGKQTVFDVAKYGAVGDGTTDDGPAIRRALAAAAKATGPASVRFEKKTYRLAKYDGAWANFQLTGASDLVVDGRGAAILLHPDNRFFTLRNCRRCEIRHFTIDYAPLPFTQGDVIAVVPQHRTIDVQLHEGYPDPPSQAWMLANYGPHGGWRHAAVLESTKPRRFTTRFRGGFLLPESVQPLDAKKRTCRIQVFDDPAKLRKVVPGDAVAFRVRYATRQRNEKLPDLPVANIRIVASADCALRDITQYCSPNMSIHLYENIGPITVDGYRIVYKPGADRLVTSLSDGIHCKSNRAGPIIQNCVFEGLMDDSINISRMVDFVDEVVSKTALRTTCSSIAWYVDSMKPGDELLAVDMKAGAVLGRAKVARVTGVTGHRRTLHLDRAIPGAFGRADAKDRKCVWLSNLTASGNGYVIRKNVFRLQMRSAMLLRASGLVEDNHVDDVGGLGVYHTNGLAFSEGPIPDGTIIRRNSIIRCRHHPGMAIGSASFNPTMAPLARNIRIEGNTIDVFADFPAIVLRNVRDSVIVNNGLFKPADVAPIEMHNCRNIRQDGNEVHGEAKWDGKR